jgi:hypothetical protein
VIGQFDFEQLKNWEFSMRTIASFAATVILLCAPLGVVLAQNSPDSGTAAAPATPAAEAAPAPAAQTPPAGAPATAAQSANPPAANPPAAKTPSTSPAATDNTPKARKKKTVGATRRQEIDRSIDTGTVPSRYRSSVPKEYQQYIPFSKD